jgi:hypothetical protein
VYSIFILLAFVNLFVYFSPHLQVVQLVPLLRKMHLAQLSTCTAAGQEAAQHAAAAHNMSAKEWWQQELQQCTAASENQNFMSVLLQVTLGLHGTTQRNRQAGRHTHDVTATPGVTATRPCRG